VRRSKELAKRSCEKLKEKDIVRNTQGIPWDSYGNLKNKELSKEQFPLAGEYHGEP
jgi:hypothetical protein